MDLNEREQVLEQKSATAKLLNESWKKMKEGKAQAVGAALKKQQGIKPLKEEEKPVDEPKVDEEPKADAPVDAPAAETPAAADVAPVEGGTDSKEEQANAQTQEFISKALSNLPSDTQLTPTAGAFKGDVVDEHLGTFTVVVYPKAQFENLHALADAVEPPEETAGAPDLAGMEGSAPAADTPAPEAPSDASPLDAPAPEAAPEAEPTPEPKPEEPKELEEGKKVCEDDEECDEEGEEEDEKKLEESRDPVNVGKKNWKLFLESRYKK